MFKKSFSIAIFIAIILLNVFAATPSRAIMEPGPGTGYATFYISPQTNNFTSPPTTAGTKFTVQVRLHNYTHVAAWQAKLVFDKSLLNITSPSTDVSYSPDHVFPPGTYSPIPASVVDFNATHKYVMMTAATFGSAEYSGMDAGLMKVQFTIIKEPDRAKKLSCPLWIEPVDTWTTDTNIDENSEDRIDGLYEIVSSIPPPPPPPPAKIAFDPDRVVDASLTPSHSFNMSVKITNGTNVYSLQFKFTFDNTVLSIVDAYQGNFPPGTSFSKTINNTGGYIIIGLQRTSPPAVNGSGTLATVKFHVESLGKSNLTFVGAETWIKDPDGASLPYKAFDGYFNNMLVPKLAVQPALINNSTLAPPQTFKINITVAEVDGVYDYEFKLGYDPTVLACLKVEIQDALGETNYVPQFSVDNVLGVVWVRVDYFEPAVPLSTIKPVTLVTLTFRIRARAVSVLDLYDTELSNTQGGLIPHEEHDGLFQPIIRDVAVMNVTPKPTLIYEGWIVKVNVTVMNQGNLTENINVKVHYGASGFIGWLNYSGVAPNANATLTIQWNTKGVPASLTNYTIWAEALPLPYETDLLDNTLYDGGVTIKMMGDVNGDGKVDGKDLALITAAFNTSPGHPRWNANADLNGDGKIDGKDVALFAKNYGRTLPP